MLTNQPTISKDLLLNDLNHSQNFIDITEEQIEIILTCKKSIHNDNKSTWIKNSTDNFDIPMGVYDSAEMTDLIVIYISDTLGWIIDLKQVCSYRDDSLVFIPDSNGLKT